VNLAFAERMVVFSDVKRRKRTVMGGMAPWAEGRYCCSKMGTNSALTRQNSVYSGQPGVGSSQASEHRSEN